jgi:hypothetical protein
MNKTDQDADKLVSDLEPADKNTPVLATLIYDTPTARGTVNPNQLLDEEVIQEALVGQAVTPDASTDDIKASASAALFDDLEAEQFRARWSEVQVEFVNDPRLAVEHADAVVGEMIEKIKRSLAGEQGLREDQWKQSEDVSTEKLRKILQGYHALFTCLMA